MLRCKKLTSFTFTTKLQYSVSFVLHTNDEATRRTQKHENGVAQISVLAPHYTTYTQQNLREELPLTTRNPTMSSKPMLLNLSK